MKDFREGEKMFGFFVRGLVGLKVWIMKCYGFFIDEGRK